MRENMNSDTKTVDFACLAAMAFVLGLLIVLVFLPSLNKNKRLEAEQKTIAQELAGLDEMAGRVSQGEALLHDLQQNNKALDILAPPALDFQGFYNAITENAQTHRIHLAETQPGKMEIGPDYTLLPVSIEATGTFRDFSKYLFAITHLPRLTKLDQLSIRSFDDERLCRIRMTITIFAQKGAAHAG